MAKIKQPVTRKVARTPLIMQLEALECGAASLAMVMAYYSKWVPLEQIREDAGVSRDGANAMNILAAARKYGFVTKGMAVSRAKLMETGKFPCIIHWNKAHFVVLNGFTRNKAIINDPANGVLRIPLSEFDECYTGIYLELIPGESFQPSGKRKSMLGFARKRLVGAGGLIALFALTTVVFYVVNAFNPILKQNFVDRILSGTDPEWLLPFILIVGGLGITTVLATLAQQIFNYKILGRLAIEGNSTFMWKILRLPISFFSQRMVGDIQQRKNTNAGIAETLINVFAPLVLNLGILIVYLVLMIRRSLILTAIGVVAVVLNVILSQLLIRKRVDLARVYARDNAMLTAFSSKGIEMVETIKSSGAETGYLHQWSGYKEAATKNKKRIAFINNAFSLIPGFLLLAIQYGILFLGVYLTMIGEFTVGAIVGFQGLLGALLAPATSIIESGQRVQEMRTEMERVDDVMEYPDDPNVVKVVPKTIYKKKNPDVELRHVTFGYSKLAEPLIKDFNLHVGVGSSVAIVGGSGCGKSTLAKLIAGLYAPWEGEILFDGKPILEIDRDVFSSMVSIVDQSIVLFEDSIESNIKMWDDTIEDFEMILAAKDASIHQQIMERGGYGYHISEGGKNLSGGERQRIEIARALANDPSVLILDEATSALDAKTEHDIIKAIKRRGITTIVIAHRLSTIRDADKILVLENGSVVEEGNHDELMAKRGRYYKLVSND